MSAVEIVENPSLPSPSQQPIFYILDTNVLIHDPTAIFNFDEHHVVIPITADSPRKREHRLRSIVGSDD